ncbi:MAG: response regulator [Actinobacteria bacterium]|nr:response regulator [Actinomycetota bacterium]
MDKPKILVVEDERDVAKVISINLKLEGMDVVEAHDGPSALAQIDQLKPDCVVLDIMLPKISGWDILKRIKSDPETSDMPVVMVTAKVAERDQLRGLGAGADKYITKPFSPLALTDAIKSVLKPQVRDVVARERRETIERLQLSTIYKISDILISAPTLDELLKGIAEKLVSLFDLPSCAMILSYEDEPEIYTFREATGKPGRGRSIGRSTFSRDVDMKLRQLFSTNRRPARISELEEFDLDNIFPWSQTAEDGYVLPLFEHNTYLGSVVIAGQSDVNLSLDEEDLLATIANQVAAAVARARLHENLREDEIVHRRLLHQTITAQETERRRLAGELHDSVVQSLVGLSYQLQAVKKKIPPESDESEVLPVLNLLEEQLNESIKELRDLLLGLRPPMLDDMGLLSAIETRLKNFGIKNGIQTSFQPPEELPPLSKDAQINLYRTIQETLNNVEKHAKASHVTIEVETTPQKLFISIRDDGKGFSVRDNREKQRRLGIAYMRERIELLGGSFKIRSEPGRGTVVSLKLPMKSILEG